MTEKVRVKHSDNVAAIAKQQKRTNRLNSIKNGLDNGSIKTFEQIFAIISETRLSIEMGISFYSFRKKVVDPGHFTFYEALQMSALFGVTYEVLSNFLWDRIKGNSKNKIFRK